MFRILSIGFSITLFFPYANAQTYTQKTLEDALITCRLFTDTLTAEKACSDAAIYRHQVNGVSTPARSTASESKVPAISSMDCPVMRGGKCISSTQLQWEKEQLRDPNAPAGNIK